VEVKMTTRRIIVCLAGLMGLIFILGIAIVLLLPRIIDSVTVKDKIRSFLSEKTNGTVTFGKLDLTWFPRPVVMISGADISTAENARASIQTVKIYPSILGLLAGQVIVSRAVLDRPVLTLRLAEWSEAPFDSTALENEIRAWLKTLSSAMPGISLAVEGGSGEITIGQRPVIAVQDLQARVNASPQELDLKLTARSNVCESFGFVGRIAAKDLASEGRITVEHLQLRAAMAALLSRSPGYVEDGDVNLKLRLVTVGLRKISAEVDGSLPSLTLHGQKGKMNIKGKGLKGAATYDAGALRATIEHLDLVSPRLSVSGELAVDRPPASVRLKLEGRNLDATALRQSALTIAPDVGAVQEVFRYVHGGTIPVISFVTQAKTFAEIWHPKNIAVTGKLRSGKIFVPGPDLDLENVDGSVALSAGILKGEEISASLGKARGRDGKLQVGLDGASAPFHFDIMVRSGAAELHSLLLRVVKDEAFHREIGKVRNLQGDLSGRLVLGDRLDAVSPTVTLSHASVSGSYDPIPYPIAVKGGRFEYDDKKIAVEDLAGTIGRSAFTGFTGTLSNDAQRLLKISSGRISLDLEQTYAWLNASGELRKNLSDLQAARGSLDFRSLSVSGPLDDPERWDFKGAGSVKNLSIQHASLPGQLMVSRARFEVTPKKLTLSDAKLEILDAALTLGGAIDNPGKEPLSVTATGAGTVGAAMTKWISRKFEISEQFTLRAPLKIADGQVRWRKANDFSFRGRVAVAEGPRVFLDMSQSPKIIAVKELTVDDGARHARLTLTLEKDDVELSFKGILGQQTLNRIFQSPPFQSGELQGDIALRAPLDQPNRFSARGRLGGGKIVFPWRNAPVAIENFFIEAGDNGVNIRSAELQWRASHLSLAGRFAAAKTGLLVDLDASADRVVWDEISAAVGREATSGGDKGKAEPVTPAIEGKIRLKAKRFDFGTYNASPLQLTATLSSRGISGDVEQAVVCGIRVAGRMDNNKDGIGFDLQLTAQDQQLQFPSRCLTDENEDLNGTFSLTAQLTGRGEGKFDFVARDGEFVRSEGLDATFDYLNATGDFKVAFPDLDKEVFPFRLLSARGTIEGETLVGDEITIQSSLLSIAGQGKVDIGRKQVDAQALVYTATPWEEAVRRIPVIGFLIGGSIFGIPVRIAGPVGRPDVSYLSPSALGNALLNIPGRILGFPPEALHILTPENSESGNK
jgi:hypothetical protein